MVLSDECSKSTQLVPYELFVNVNYDGSHISLKSALIVKFLEKAEHDGLRETASPWASLDAVRGVYGIGLYHSNLLVHSAPPGQTLVIRLKLKKILGI